MKILSIYFKNLNSLQGEHLIDFSKAPLAEAGVFAITGPNGSGKSTILDAITLALYGETFRFARPAAYVMTQNTTDAFAQVEFRIGEQRYRARWEAVSRDGVLAPVAMNLLRLGEGATVLADSVTQVRSAVTEILGLDFRNFTRSTLLAQGDFAAFLNALDSERLDILEKIVSQDIYADYKQTLISNAETEQIKLQQLQGDLQAIPLMDAATQEASELDLADFKAQQFELDQQLVNLSQQLDTAKDLTQLQEQLNLQQAQQQQLITQQEQIASDLQRIGQYKTLAPLLQDFNYSENLAATNQQDQQTLSDYRNELQQLKNQIQALGDAGQHNVAVANRSLTEQQEIISAQTFQAELLQNENHSSLESLQFMEQQYAEKQALATEVAQWLEAHKHDAALLDGFPDIGRLRKLADDISALTRQQKLYQKSAKDITQRLQSQQSSMRVLQKETPTLQQHIEVYTSEIKKLGRGLSLDELKQLVAEQQAKVRDLQELLLLSKAHSRFRDSFWVRLGLVKKPVDPNTSAIVTRLQELQIQLAQEETIKQALEHAAFNEALLNKMQADRVHLVNDEPCPLCGALKHPYVNEPPKPSNSQQALAAQKARVQNLNITLARGKQKLAAAEKQLQAKQLQQDRLARIRSDWSTLCNRLGIMRPDLEITNKPLMKQLLKEQMTELNDISQIYKQVQRYQQKIDHAQQQVERKSTKLELLQNKVAELDVSAVKRPEELRTLAEQLAQLAAEEKVVSVEVMGQLERLGEKLPSKGKEDALFDRLHQRRQDYQLYLLREKNVAEELQALRQNIDALRTVLASQQQKIQEALAKLHIEQGCGLELAILEKQKLISEKETQIAAMQAQVHTLQQNLQQQAIAVGLPSFTQLAEILRLLPQQNQLQQQQQEIARQIQQVEKSLQPLQRQYDNLLASIGANKSLVELEADYKSTYEQADIARLETQRLEDLLLKQLQRLQKHQELAVLIAQQERQLQTTQQDLALLNQESGHAFRRKVQRHMADKLLAQTNIILEKISGRYYVRQQETEQGLGLEIEDTYQQNLRRLPKTLSGGESFVVSLALALGLSELASNGQAIESLFLDEGFGNLDAEALVTVIATLENLPTHGKKVGVISHVDGVRQRIKTQIEMVKKPNGLSELRAVA